jgi:DNA repair protein RadC
MTVAFEGARAPTLKDLPAEERPRERLFALGEGALSDAELLGIVIGAGRRGATAVDLGRALLARYGGLRGLAGAAARDIKGLGGIGPARAARLRACAEVARRVAAAPLEERVRIETPEQVFRHFGPLLRDGKRERFYLVLLDRKNRVLRSVQIVEGGLAEAVVHPREAFAPALREGAAAVIAVHNHPSGDPSPSEEDVRLTARLEACGELLGIPVLDHVIVGGDSYVSLRERGSMGILPARMP